MRAVLKAVSVWQRDRFLLTTCGRQVVEIVTIKQRNRFIEIAKKGNRVCTAGLVLQALKINDSRQSNLNVGFTVTKKVGNAVERNRIKRRLRAAVKQVMPDLADTMFAYVIIGRKATLTRPFEGLIKDLRFALHRIHENNEAS